jgi:hypothetical protein
MEKITLQPGVWTRLNGTAFQPKSDDLVKIAYVRANDPADIVAPVINTDVFVTNAHAVGRLLGFDDVLQDYYTAIFLMPFGSAAMTVVTC